MTNCKYSNEDTLRNFEELHKIGLTRLEATCYSTLCNQTFLSAKQIGEITGKHYRSITKCLKNLEQKGFVRQVYTGIHPNKYEAILLDTALKSYADWQRRQVTVALKAQLKVYYQKELSRLV